MVISTALSVSAALGVICLATLQIQCLAQRAESHLQRSVPVVELQEGELRRQQVNARRPSHGDGPQPRQPVQPLAWPGKSW